MIFAIGNILPLLAINYPHCFGIAQPPSCNQSAADAVTYIEARPAGEGGCIWARQEAGETGYTVVVGLLAGAVKGLVSRHALPRCKAPPQLTFSPCMHLAALSICQRSSPLLARSPAPSPRCAALSLACLCLDSLLTLLDASGAAGEEPPHASTALARKTFLRRHRAWRQLSVCSALCRLTATIMLVGGALLTSSAGNDGQFLAMFLTSLFLFGTGKAACLTLRRLHSLSDTR